MSANTSAFPYNPETFRAQVPLVSQFVKHFVFHRALKAVPTDQLHASHLLSLSSDAHILQAVIYWCMVFGASSNETHWERLWIAPGFADAYRAGIPQATGKSMTEFRAYWKEVVDFRNLYVAHATIEPYATPVPELETALKIALYWEEWVRRVMPQAIFNFPTLREEVPLYEAIAKGEVDVVAPALAASRTIGGAH